MSFILESFDLVQDSEVDSRSSLYVFDSLRDSMNSFRIDSLNSAEFLTSYKNTVFLNGLQTRTWDADKIVINIPRLSNDQPTYPSTQF